MKTLSFVLRGLAFVLASITTLNLHAQTDYTVTERGLDFKVLEKTTVENGTNRVHRYTELATGLNYTNASGQLTESKEQITIQPGGGAAATQGRHKVFFPADIYNGVIEVVTPDGKHLKSRPLGVSYDDGSNTVFIATLKNAQGYLTSSNQVTYRDAFTGFKADLVCTYRRGGFECDLVFRQQPPTPGDYGLDETFSTLSMVTEFFNTADPVQVPGASDEWFGLQDSTLKFGKLTMTHGKAFAFHSSGSNYAQTNSQSLLTSAATIPVYKSWVNSGGRKFLIETVPVLDLAEDLSALPLQAKAENGNLKPENKTLLAASGPKFQVSGLKFPPSHEVAACTNQILLASADFNREPGVVLDYNTINADGSTNEFTFSTGATYLISDAVWFDLVNLEAGAVVKFGHNHPAQSTYPEIWVGGVNCQTTADNPAFFTMMDDDKVGEKIADSTGVPSNLGVNYLHGAQFIEHVWFYYANTALLGDDLCAVNDCQFSYCGQGIFNLWISARNCLFYNCGIACYATGNGDLSSTMLANCTVDRCGIFFDYGNASDLTVGMTNNLLTFVTNVVHLDVVNPYVTFAAITNHTAITNGTGIYQAAGDVTHYLATASPFRNVGTTAIDPDLLAELNITTTFAPEDGSILDTNTPDLGYHYAILTPPEAFSQTLDVCRSSLSKNQITLSGFSPDGRPLTFQIVTNPLHGSLSGTPSSVLYYAGAYHGLDIFWFRVNDGPLTSSNASITLNVGMRPIANDVFVQVCSNTTAVVTLDESDPCREPLSAVILSFPMHGTLSGSGTNRFYTPTNAFVGDDSFVYMATNPFTNSDPQTVTLRVNGTPIVNAEGSPQEISKPTGVGNFTASLDAPTCANLKVYYTLGGTGSNGVDFVATNAATGQRVTGGGVNFLILSNILVGGQIMSQVQITALPTPSDPFDKTVTFTLIPTNGYVIDVLNATATITIHGDTAALFTTVTKLDNQPVGIDYSSIRQSLIISLNVSGSTDNDFASLTTNAVTGSLILTNFSKVSGSRDEIKLATVKQTTNGFTNGDVYFGEGRDGVVGWLSADGTRSNLNWSILSTNGDSQTLLRGGLYLDQTGTWSNHLIVVTGNGSSQGGDIWRVRASGINGLGTRVASITNNLGNRVHLEGVLTLTNDATKWGPWAGKIITGAESETPPLVISINTNGAVTNFVMGIRPEDFDLIPTNQDLYCMGVVGNAVEKVPRTFFNKYVGMLLITESGDGPFPNTLGKLHIVNWDNSVTNFVVRTILHNQGEFEHVTFAPINLPSH